MAENQLERVQSFQYPRAHVGHLTSAQSEALQQFKALCQEQGYYTPAGPRLTSAASHDDETLLRYLRARKFIPKDAFEQFKDTEDWRKRNKLEELYETIDIHDYDETKRLYPQWTGRRDKRGIPVYVFEVATLNAKTMATYDKSVAEKPSSTDVPTKLLRLFPLYENLTRFVLPLCSAVPGRPYSETPVSQSNNIVDISRVGLKQFWNLKGHMQDASQLATAHYPETLDRIFIIGAPSFFPTVWSWIKRWFDPITVSKIFILSAGSVTPTLEQYIDPSNIPKKYGGQLDWQWGDLPFLEPAIQKGLIWQSPEVRNGEKTFPIGPIRWEENDDGTMTALAVGSVGGQPRKLVVAGTPVPLDMPEVLDEKDIGLEAVTTTGTHTQPNENDYFPVTGDTPDDQSDTEPAPNAVTGSTASTSAISASGTRTGTSTSRFDQQAPTLASGQMASGTPANVDAGHGDKVAIMEPSTVGQAPKDVSVPDAAKPEDDEDKKASMSNLAQVTVAAGAVAAGAVGMGSSIASSVGYGGEVKKEEEEEEAKTGTAEKGEESISEAQTGQEASEIESAATKQINGMHSEVVEDYIRAQYKSENARTSNVALKSQ